MTSNSSIQPYFSSLVSDLTTRSERAAQGLLSLGSEPLREFLRNQLSASPGTAGALLADPVFEPTFGWAEDELSMGDLAGTLLHPKLVEVMSRPPKELAEDYTFPKDRKPFRHQIEAWKTLKSGDVKSLVVTSGTGSGKTECFLVPILDQLVREAEQDSVLQGVRALFIYPLNALINSQQNRLDAWTDGLGGKVRHCLYTGGLENEVKSNQRKYSGQVLDRVSLRASAPPILVTNATMLEYMLVRKEDEPILKQSEGQLRWIVLDEAHSYIGSQAAEMALLLRRVMLAFKVEPAQVRFIATSATFGSDEKTIESLTQFLADMGGIRPEQVHVVHGRRQIPSLPAPKPVSQSQGLASLCSIEPSQEVSQSRYDALVSSATARRIRSAFIDADQTKVRSLSRLSTLMSPAGPAAGELLQWLDVVSGTKNEAEQSFLPLRGHLFHNVVSTVRVCIDSTCRLKTGTPLNADSWPYGMVYTSERTHCNCGSLLLPLVSCNECNEPFLVGARQQERLHDPSLDDEDEFELNDAQDDDSEREDVDNESTKILVTNRPLPATQDSIFIDRESCQIRGIHTASGEIAITAFMLSGHECPSCGAKSPQGKLMRNARIGTPFTLSTVISTLLEYCPPSKEPSGKPFGGRKMISFTDSRQGTARIAVKLQQDSERSRIRGLVYHKLLITKPAGGLSPEDQKDFEDLLAEEAIQPLSTREKRYLDSLREKNVAGADASVSWDEMVAYLSTTPDMQFGLMDHYHRLAPHVFPAKTEFRSLAGMFLAREFYRRPKRANSLETMGLVQVEYPKLASIPNKPTEWPLDLHAWRAYLKVLLDFHVRENSFIQLDEGWLSIIGAKIRPKWFYAPGTQGSSDSRFKMWPQSTGRTIGSRPVLILCKAFGWDPEANQDRINSLLLSAWRDLTQTVQLLTKSGDEFQLSLKDLSFRLPSSLSICPVTRRFIDTTLEGISPYTPQTNRQAVIRVEPVEMPRPTLPLYEGAAQVVACARQWVDSDPTVAILRDRGLWSDVHDRVIEGGNYFRTAEHSAQQSKKRLDLYETDFKAGRINLLSCSTTMEMGVDIGGITVDAMNNVPPHPANYLQRAGRAGRRREGRALAMTVCKNTPHDQAVFDHPTWAFETAMRMPKVSLQSPDLVQRHVNAYLLSNWMKAVIGNFELKAMTSGGFLTADSQLSLAERFILWCEQQASAIAAEVDSAIQMITENSALANLKRAILVSRAADMLREVSADWFREFDAAKSQLDYLQGSKSAALRALEVQIRRIQDEYLLSELATRRFLPGYGFPTDIVSFDNRSLSTIKKEGATKVREDNRGRFRELATRDRITGLREYAPGAELVMDGLVYRSAGITLNWRAPASEHNIREAQLFKYAWRCRSCGTSSNQIVSEPDIFCDACGYQLEQDDTKRYLVPSGFAVDFRGKPHNDISNLRYIPVRSPWLSIRENSWLKLANPVLGQHRSSSQAHLFHYTAGEYGNGFAICLECGKSEPMLSSPDGSASSNEQYLPKVFRADEQHNRLRGGRDDNLDPVCPGSHNAWKIQRNVYLGHDATTDALEIMLSDATTGTWLNDGVAAYSIAVALRNAIAAQLGVQSEELGCESKPIQWNGSSARIIQVYDLRSGGYASQAAAFINDRMLWERVLTTLDCSCQHACQKCLLGFDTRFEADSLNRFAALKWINKDWLNSLSLPADSLVFGAETIAESSPILEAVERELAKGVHDKVIVHLGGDPAEWDFDAARHLRNRLGGWKSRGLRVHLSLPPKVSASLAEECQYRLGAFSTNDIVIEEAPPIPLKQGMMQAISLCSSSHCLSWATDSSLLVTPNRYWGVTPAGSRLLRGRLNQALNGTPIAPEIFRLAKNSNAAEITIKSEIDGPLDRFGARFWDYLCQTSPLVKSLFSPGERLKKVTYSDRYVRNPVTCALVVDAVHELCSRVDPAEGLAICVYSSTYTKDVLAAVKPWHDWPSHEARDKALFCAFESSGIDAVVKSHPERPHGRYLDIEMATGKVIRLRLDQGFSYWEFSGNGYFDFKTSAEKQGEAIAGMKSQVAASKGSETQVFVRTK